MTRFDGRVVGMVLFAAILAGEVGAADPKLPSSSSVAIGATPVNLPAGASTDWWSQVQANIRLEEYAVTRSAPDGRSRNAANFESQNPAHHFRAEFRGDGIELRPLESVEPAWSWGLSLVSWGRPGSPSAVPEALLHAERNRIELDRGVLSEWYVNSQNGLEQGFTIPAPPAAGGHGLALDISLSGSLIPRFSEDGQAIDFFGSGSVGVLRFDHLVVTDATGTRLSSRFEPVSGGIRIAVDDSAAIYPITIDPLATSAAWTGSGDEDDVNFGVSVATAGDVNADGYSDVVVGAYFHNAGAGPGALRGRAYLYLGSPAGLATSAAWIGSGDENAAFFGFSVATAGDVNGDGYSDVVVGAYAHDAGAGGSADRGRAYLYFGSPSGLAASAAWTGSGDENTSRYGSTVATAGDVNGDGYSDVVVNAYLHDAGAGASANRGRAYLYLGSALGLASSASWTGSGDENFSRFGYSVATAGDVNGDGYSDVIVGAYAHDAGAGGGASRGRAYLHLGSSLGLATTATWIGAGDENGSGFGYSVATAGDVNGDGYSDVVVGAGSHDAGAALGADRGRAYVYLGSSSGLATGTAWTGSGDENSGVFGISVATAGDVNGDGYSDVIVGAHTHDAGAGSGADRGQAYLFLGSSSGLVPTAAWMGSGDENLARFGDSVATAGDVNGDGYSDIVVGATFHDAGAGAAADRGRAYLYLGSSSGPATTSAWTGSGDEDSAYFGYSSATAGDVNGDGYSDVIVGAYYHDAGAGGGADRGRAYVYLGSSSGLATTAAWTGSGDQDLALFGYSVATAGDVNGDGYSDVVVGAYQHNGVAWREGRAYVYLGSASGLATTAAWIGSGDEDSAFFGVSVATAGDVNGDGYSDVVVGAYGHDAGAAAGSNRGRTYLYLGSASGLATTAAWTGSGDENSAWFGLSVATAGDVNGDGNSEVIVGAPFHDAGAAGSNRGRAYVYLGSSSGLATTAAWTGSGDEASAHFGFSGATAGDVNGDGYSDVIVGAYLHDAGFGAFADRGRAYVYLGSASGLATTAVWTQSGDENEVQFGASAATVGDVNADGYSDVVVGAQYHDAGAAGSDRGRAYVYFGSASGLATTPAWTGSGDEDGAVFGLSVATAGDVNGDGSSDVVVGAQYHNAEGGAGAFRGRAYLYFGNDGLGSSVLSRQLRSDLTASIAPGGLAYQQKLRLGLRMRSVSGRALARIQWQLAPLGATFQPTVNPIQSDSNWWDTGLAGPFRTIPVTLPDQPVAYTWRARVDYRDATSPFQPHGPWFTLAANGLRETDLRSTNAVPPPPCVFPDEPTWLYSVVKVGTDHTLNFQDPNQPNQRTGYHVRRSNDAVPPKSTWPLVATNVVDMDAGAANLQWTDHSGDDPTPSAIWYFQVTAYNANCPAEGPF